MPEGEPKFFDINPAEDENPHEVDERVAKPEIKDDEDDQESKPIDAVEGFSDEELEKAHHESPEDEGDA